MTRWIEDAREPAWRLLAVCVALAAGVPTNPARAQDSAPRAGETRTPAQSAGEGPDRGGDAEGMSEADVPREEVPIPVDDPDDNLEPGAGYEQARTLYLSGQFDQCVEAFVELLSPKGKQRLVEPRHIERARLYYAACLMGLGRDADAQEQMRAAILANPRMLPPNPLVFPAPVVSRFAVVRSGLLKELQAKEDAEVREAQQRAREERERAARERERIRILEDLAAKESVIVQNRRWIAALPFGVGQFQNGDNSLGLFFLVSEGVLATTVVAATSYELWLLSEDDSVEVIAFNSKVAQAHNLQRWSLVGLAILTAFGITEAQLSYVPERKIGDRERELPPAIRSGSQNRDQREGVRLRPTLSPMSGGGVAGVAGVF